MLWYGINLWKNSLRLSNIKKKRKLGFTKPYFLMFVPYRWELLLVKDTTRHIYYMLLISNLYYINVPIIIKHKKQLLFNLNLRTLWLPAEFSYNYSTTYISALNFFHKNFLTFSIKKLTFKGKGYYVYKNKRNTIAPQFGYSHRIYIYSYFFFIKFLSKTTLILFGINYMPLVDLSNYFRSYRPLNIFTARGIRFNGQYVYKKVGKVSTYR